MTRQSGVRPYSGMMGRVPASIFTRKSSRISTICRVLLCQPQKLQSKINKTLKRARSSLFLLSRLLFYRSLIICMWLLHIPDIPSQAYASPPQTTVATTCKLLPIPNLSHLSPLCLWLISNHSTSPLDSPPKHHFSPSLLPVQESSLISVFFCLDFTMTS